MLGYVAKQVGKKRHLLVKHEAVENMMEDDGAVMEIDNRIGTAIGDHDYCQHNGNECESCNDKQNLINTMIKKVNSLSLTVTNLEQERQRYVVNNSKTPFSWRKIKTDKGMNFYTGITSIAIFNAIFSLLQPYGVLARPCCLMI